MIQSISLRPPEERRLSKERNFPRAGIPDNLYFMTLWYVYQSEAEHSAVNRVAAGSSPARGVKSVSISVYRLLEFWKTLLKWDRIVRVAAKKSIRVVTEK